MNLIGKWKVKELPVYPEPSKMIFVAVEDFPKYITDEDLLNDYMHLWTVGSNGSQRVCRMSV